jgi:ATP-dependent phosphoenolpyruvate carboxykinase
MLDCVKSLFDDKTETEYILGLKVTKKKNPRIYEAIKKNRKHMENLLLRYMDERGRYKDEKTKRRDLKKSIKEIEEDKNLTLIYIDPTLKIARLKIKSPKINRRWD